MGLKVLSAIFFFDELPCTRGKQTIVCMRNDILNTFLTLFIFNRRIFRFTVQYQNINMFSGGDRGGSGGRSNPLLPAFKYPMGLTETKLFHFHGILKKIDKISKANPHTFIQQSPTLSEILDPPLMFKANNNILITSYNLLIFSPLHLSQHMRFILYFLHFPVTKNLASPGIFYLHKYGMRFSCIWIHQVGLT